MNSPRALAPYLVISALCFAAIFWLLYDFFALHERPSFNASAEAMPKYDLFESANVALEAEISAPSAEFATDAASPFKLLGAAASFSRAPAGVRAKQQRSPFVLRGLMKDPPIAVIEDARGETHIKARGDFIHGAQIISVGNNSVVIRDSSGTFELTVEGGR